MSDAKPCPICDGSGRIPLGDDYDECPVCPVLDAQREEIERLRAQIREGQRVMRCHHQHHLDRTEPEEIKQDGEVLCEIVPAHEYADSTLYKDTDAWIKATEARDE